MNKLQSDEALTRVTLDASRRNIPIEIVPRDKGRSLEEAADALGISASALLKTLVIKRTDGTFVFALIPGGRKLDWAKLRGVMGVNKLSLPSSDIAWDVTHYESGTITPFGSHTVLPVYIDASVFEEPVSEQIGLGSGDRAHGLLVRAKDLVSGFDATIADISTPE